MLCCTGSVIHGFSDQLQLC
uniref:Uncharacterized protein n=1 Tax=Rhizophora mucronata TaxID=61149 RepID=A0A2P2N371_RHIMU